MFAAASSRPSWKGKGRGRGRGRGRGKAAPEESEGDDCENPIVAPHSDLVDTALLAKIGSMEAASRIDVQHKRSGNDIDAQCDPTYKARAEPLNTAVARMLKRASSSGEVFMGRGAVRDGNGH